ncbi:MAG TPA: shikimate dehydrogenase, partial [Solirubrobacteraceae bacterium]|nr:shikimate dehydrogenase [Solirubrobacteraceae bacterium]
RAEQLAHELGAAAVAAPRPADLLVNCTSVGLRPDAEGGEDELAQLGLSAQRLGDYGEVVDLVYGGEGATELLRVAQGHGARTVDGLEILLAQGSLSFELWTGRQAPLEAMRGALV